MPAALKTGQVEKIGTGISRLAGVAASSMKIWSGIKEIIEKPERWGEKEEWMP